MSSALTTPDRSLAVAALPNLLTPAVERWRAFSSSIAGLLDNWVQRRASVHTQRAYRADILALVGFMGWKWPEESHRLLSVSVADVQRYRAWLVESGAAPKTLNRRISSLSGFFQYIGACMAELRIPAVFPNPAHAQFIARSASDPLVETVALTASEARALMDMPAGDGLRDVRDRAILKLYLYTGIRLAAGCRLMVEDFSFHGATPTLRLREKGDRVRTIGIHRSAAQAIQEYIERAGLSSGALFRSVSQRTGDRGQGTAAGLAPVSMYLLLRRYLRRLPGAMRKVRNRDGLERFSCIYTPHSLRATTATLLLDAGVDITKVQDLLGHRHITTTQIYDKRRRQPVESASHAVPL
jgi:site-specific recombinase XerD